MDWIDQVTSLIDSTEIYLSNEMPSQWAENHRVMTTDVSPFPGKFKFDRTPYLREVLDTISPNHPAKKVAVMKGAQIGFALDEQTLIPTPNGFVKMKHLRVGDHVFDENGVICTVTKTTSTMIDHECFDVLFSDGSIIRADAEHLWTVMDEKKWETRKKVTINTKEISTTFKHRGRNRYAIDVCAPIQFPGRNLPIDPYLFGVWLGDGHSSGNRITCHVDDSFEYIEQFENIGQNVETTKNGHIVTLRLIKPDDECLRGHKYDAPKIAEKNVCRKCQRDRYNDCVDPIKHESFGERLVELGVFDNKHIPKKYLFSSVKQRMALLQGLIDTDGHIAKNSQVEFYNINKQLIDDVMVLVASLGFKPRLRIRKSKGKQIIIDKPVNHSDLWVIDFKGWAERPVARLKRKKERLQPIDSMRKSEILRRRIVDVIPCESVPVRCISVDSKSHLFLAGESMIPTHNSTGVIENGIGYIISQNPGNILFLTGHGDLTDEAMSGKIDQMIDSCGLRPMIRPNVLRKKNQRTGDTNKSKEFPGGSLVAGSAGNHKLLRQRSVRFGFVDDFDAARGATKESGSTTEMIEQRFAAYGDKMKLYYISTPEVKQTSNIEPLFLRGDQRFFHVPCQCCGVFIPLKWKIDLEGDEVAGIHYKLDDKGQLIDGSVGYVCPECGGFFDDRNKYDFLNDGVWQPTAEPQESGFYSYHISSLYAPPGMYDWEHYVRQYLKANPMGEKTDEKQMQTFVNLVLGETYEKKGEAPKANDLQKNVRDYAPGTLPEQLSVKDGNGQIVLITLAADLNGKMHDARLDWECVAWTESGANYSINHGSVGTFVPNQTREQKDRDDRAKWTYQHGLPNSVWPEFQKVIETVYTTDTGRRMKPFITGIDVGNTFMGAPYHFIENNNSFVIGLKGKDSDKGRRFGVDTPTFRLSKERNDLYLVEVNQLKDELAEYMRLKWDGENDQPTEFMNFPFPVEKKYQYKTYFSHYEGEHRIIDKNADGTGVSARWVKVNSAAQNHFWDCRIYNMVLRDIITDMACKEAGIKHGVWKDYVDMIFGRI